MSQNADLLEDRLRTNPGAVTADELGNELSPTDLYPNESGIEDCERKSSRYYATVADYEM